MNGLHYLLGAVHCCPCEFDSIQGFRTYLDPYFSDVAFERTAVVERVEAVVKKIDSRGSGVDRENALAVIVSDDLRRLIPVLEQRLFDDPKQSLPVLMETFQDVLRGLGLEFPKPKLFIVETFPEPYDKMDWTAMSPDAADKEDYGIEPGNYFKEDELVPIKSEFLLAHEMLHQIISWSDPHLLGRGLEEGLAVVLGELYIGRLSLGEGAALLYSIYSWFDARATRINRLYAEYARMAAMVYDRYGLDGILALVHGGRREIKRVERLCLSGNFELELPRGNWDDAFKDVLAKFALTTVPSLTVSPLTKYILRHVRPGARVEEICRATQVAPDLVRECLSELQESVMLLLLDGDRVLTTDVPATLSSSMIRYQV